MPKRMKNLEKLAADCLAEVRAAGIQAGTIVEWKVNRRAKKRWGLCHKDKDGKFHIQVAARLLEDDRVPEKACKETIIHEILHTAPDGMKHTGKWKEYANIMNKKYGYNIKRTTSGEEKGVENYQAKRLSYQYKFKCKKCGQTILKKKKCKFTHYYKNYSCTICGTKNAFVKV